MKIAATGKTAKIEIMKKKMSKWPNVNNN
jgi:hypothetical protein